MGTAGGLGALVPNLRSHSPASPSFPPADTQGHWRHDTHTLTHKCMAHVMRMHITQMYAQVLTCLHTHTVSANKFRHLCTRMQSHTHIHAQVCTLPHTLTHIFMITDALSHTHSCRSICSSTHTYTHGLAYHIHTQVKDASSPMDK